MGVIIQTTTGSERRSGLRWEPVGKGSTHHTLAGAGRSVWLWDRCGGTCVELGQEKEAVKCLGFQARDVDIILRAVGSPERVLARVCVCV